MGKKPIKNTAKKVLVIASTFPRYTNDSTPRFVFDLSKRLNSEFDVIALVPHAPKSLKKEVMEGLDVRRFVYFRPESMQKLCYNGGIIPNMKSSLLAAFQMPFLIISEFFAAKNIIKKENVGMVHAHWMLPQGLVGVWLKKLHKTKLITTVHGSDLFPLKSGFLIKLQHFVCKNSDFITVNTEATKEELISRFPEFKNKVSVIPMGIDTGLFKKRNAKKPSKYSKNKLILFVGRLSDQKGMQYLISAMPEILKQDGSAKLLIIGTGPYEKKLKQAVKSNSVEKNVEFLGALSPSEVSKYYSMADVFVLPAVSNETGTEALGLTLIEAMASGCAVIGTDIGGLKSAIKNGVNGIQIRQKNSGDIANAVVGILKNPGKSAMMGKNAAKFAKENYSWEKIAKKFSVLYGKVLK